jgi:primosomal protein N' (replication factor Y) (superfamily II helicase)
MFADVILPLNLPQILTYGVPLEMEELLQPGMRVEVALGKNKQYAGIVERLHNEKPDAYQVKPIKGIIDEEPVVNERQLQFWRWITQYYMAAPGEVMQAALPAHLKLMGETRLEWVGDDSIVYEWTDEAYLASEALQMRKELTITELRSIVGTRYFAAVLNELLEKEVIQINENLETTYKPRREKVVTLAAAYKEEKELIVLFDQLSRAPKQLELLMAHTELSIKLGIVRQQDLLERTNASPAQVKALADKGIFIIEEKNVDRLRYAAIKEGKEIVFTPAQQTAYDELNEGLKEKNVALLHGVTGSGKTLLYIHKIKECIAAGKQAILLLPEIGLTTQLVTRLHAYFGDILGVYHSHFSNNERVEIWEKVRKGTYKVVAGPRSALWLPYSDVGVIITDEEHDGSYKQKDPAPRFHARDAAIYLASLFDAKVILGSATPSVESLFNVQHNKYAYVPLKERYQGVTMPVIEVINAKSLETVRQLGVKLLTPELQKAMLEALQKRKQIILFQNRRGYAPFQLCTVCGWVPQCKNCSVSLTYHKSTDKMHCHYCGLKAAVTQSCPQCGSTRLISKSFGTEKIEEEVQQVFPDARVARMDVDSMRGKHSMAELLDQLEKRKIDILVGTQMVVKGLDFASVGLVGILSADSLLSYPDFRVNERAFQLMEQVSGRAGRVDGKGRVLIQAYNIQHPVLQWVKDHDVHTFYTQEIRYREHFSYPPFSRLIKIIFKHQDEPKAIAAAQLMAEALQTFSGIAVQGPSPAIVPRVRNMFLQEIWIKCPRDNKLLDSVKSFLKNQKNIILGKRGNTNVQVLFDVDPM